MARVPGSALAGSVNVCHRLWQRQTGGAEHKIEQQRRDNQQRQQEDQQQTATHDTAIIIHHARGPGGQPVEHGVGG